MKKSKGFTLIELIMVIVIFGIIVASVWPKYFPDEVTQQSKSQITNNGDIFNTPPQVEEQYCKYCGSKLNK